MPSIGPGCWASLGASVARINEIEGFSLRGEGVYWQPRKAKKEMSVQLLVLQPRVVRNARFVEYECHAILEAQKHASRP